MYYNNNEDNKFVYEFIYLFQKYIDIDININSKIYNIFFFHIITATKN